MHFHPNTFHLVMLVFWLVLGPLNFIAFRRRGDSAGAKGFAFLGVGNISVALAGMTSGADPFFDFVSVVFIIAALVYLGKSWQAQWDRKQAIKQQNEVIERK